MNPRKKLPSTHYKGNSLVTLNTIIFCSIIKKFAIESLNFKITVYDQSHMHDGHRAGQGFSTAFCHRAQIFGPIRKLQEEVIVQFLTGHES